MTLSTQTDMQRNKLMHLENTLVMYGIYNMETLVMLVKQFMHYTVDKHYMKVCLQARYQQPMNFIQNSWFMWHTALCS